MSTYITIVLFKEQFYWKGCYFTIFKVLYPELKILYYIKKTLKVWKLRK